MTGLEVKEKLKKTGISLKLIAERAEMTPQSLNNLFKVSDVKVGVLEKLATAINENVYYFFDKGIPVSQNSPVKEYSDSLIELPYIPVSARATFAGSFADTLHEPGATYGVYKQKNYDYTAAQILEINGDSMEPTLINKEKVLIKELCDSKWEYFTGLAAIAFKNMFVVKRITSNFDGILTLSSDNPMGGTFKVKIDDVRIIYTIEHSIYRPIK